MTFHKNPPSNVNNILLNIIINNKLMLPEKAKLNNNKRQNCWHLEFIPGNNCVSALVMLHYIILIVCACTRVLVNASLTS